MIRAQTIPPLETNTHPVSCHVLDDRTHTWNKKDGWKKAFRADLGQRVSHLSAFRKTSVGHPSESLESRSETKGKGEGKNKVSIIRLDFVCGKTGWKI